MKVKHFIYASACVMGLAACNNEEIVVNGNGTFDGKGELVELKDGFAVAVGKAGLEESRALDANGRFQWMPTSPGTANEIVERIGLCWTGVNNLNPAAAPSATTGDMVYTNYEFLHAGWLYTGQTAPVYDVCDEYVTNGEYNKAASMPAPSVTAAYSSAYAATTSGKTLDFKKGLFQTKNSAIYSGEYIVYYPYSDEFFDSPIVASAPKTVTIDNTAANRYETMASNSFSIGYVQNFAGGQDTDNFVTNMLSAGAYIGFKNTGTTNVQLKQVVLLAAGANDAFITKQELSAKAIKNANNVPANIGTNLYLGNAAATSKTVVANYSTTLTVNSFTTSATGYVVVPVLPTTISDLKILLVDNDNKTALIDCGNVKFESIAKGSYSLQKLIDLKTIEFKKEYIATDAASLNSIITTIDALSPSPTATTPVTVRTIGEVALNDQSDITIGSATHYQYVRFYGDKLIVPADQKLTLKNNVTVENDIDVMHKGCCGNAVGDVTIYSAKLTGIVNNYGLVNMGDGSAYNKLVLDGATLNNLKGTVTEKGVEVAYDATINVKKKMTLSLVSDAALNNAGTLTTEGTGLKNEDGTITIEQNSTATIANSGIIVNGGNLNPSNGLSNTTASAVFVDQVGSQLTGFGLDNTAGGQYICEVNDQTRYNTALTSAIRPTTLVRFVAAGTYQIAAGNVNNSKGNMVGFEIKYTGTNNIIFAPVPDSDATTVEAEFVSTIKNLSLTELKRLNMNKVMAVEDKLVMTDGIFNVNYDLTVGSEINVGAGTMHIVPSVNVNAINSNCDLKVANGVSVLFDNFGVSYFKNISNNGSIDIRVASGAAGVAHELWTKSYTTGATGVWANNSLPMQY